MNALILTVMCMLFAPAAAPPAPVAEPDAQVMSIGQPAEEAPTAGSCSSEGDECLTHGAPACCRGLRCVGSVCKK